VSSSPFALADEELDLKRVLEPAQMMTGRSLGNVVDFDGSRQAAGADNLPKGPKYLPVRTTQPPVQAIERQVQKTELSRTVWIFAIVFRPARHAKNAADKAVRQAEGKKSTCTHRTYWIACVSGPMRSRSPQALTMTDGRTRVK
jgi:hypothetical protein